MGAGDHVASALYRLAEVNAAGDLGWWRIVGRDAVVFPEAVAMAGVLLSRGHPSWRRRRSTGRSYVRGARTIRCAGG
ncbi:MULTISPECIES: hypothetical protein [Streptomyces griseus group]|uniref:hypothetical protein n=1 Tax=Streptomyces griseus group TaxID=629295 RepID=UPI002E164014|nr:hypothetical protein OG366_00240 [Streptomyces cyaneofuscatus]WSI52701.1 hypothetical protein OG366_36920 [Streptomyces cyaneofuscatus]WST12510.1 hypothetical protein OG721_00325 [Streptomyces microflavus]WST19527.1 hypothetical protein OG721_38775 [Streptomyces microflavus]